MRELSGWQVIGTMLNFSYKIRCKPRLSAWLELHKVGVSLVKQFSDDIIQVLRVKVLL